MAARVTDYFRIPTNQVRDLRLSDAILGPPLTDKTPIPTAPPSILPLTYAPSVSAF